MAAIINGVPCVKISNAAAAGVYVRAGTSATWDVYAKTATTGGCSIFRSLDLDESQEEVKGSAGTLYGGIAINLASAVRYLKFYNAPTASVTVGTTTPVITIPIPAESSNLGGGFVLPIPAQGVAFSAGITVAAVTGVADNDTTGAGTNEVVVNLWYA